MNPWNFFDQRVCLTTKRQEWKIAQVEFARVGLEVEKFLSINDIGPHQSFSRSVRYILINAYESGAHRLLHLEDDCVFRDYSHLEKALSELPEDWDVVYLGANILCEPERFSEHLFKVTRCWTTHAIGYNRKVLPWLLEHQPGFSERMFDNWLGDNLHQLNAYIVAPMVAWQRPHESSIWGRYDDYTEIFDNSAALLVE